MVPTTADGYWRFVGFLALLNWFGGLKTHAVTWTSFFLPITFGVGISIVIWIVMSFEWVAKLLRGALYLVLSYIWIVGIAVVLAVLLGWLEMGFRLVRRY